MLKCHITPAIMSRVKVATCDYEVVRCDFVARQSRASKSRDIIAGVIWHLGIDAIFRIRIFVYLSVCQDATEHKVQ